MRACRQGGGACLGGCLGLGPPLQCPLPPCGMPSGCGFFYGALDGHPSFPSHAAPGRCVLTAAAAGVPWGVVSAVAGPGSWRTGGCAGGWGGRFADVAAHAPSACRSSITCPLKYPPTPRRWGMQMLNANPYHRGPGLQSNHVRTNGSSVTLPLAPFAVTDEVP